MCIHLIYYYYWILRFRIGFTIIILLLILCKQIFHERHSLIHYDYLYLYLLLINEKQQKKRSFPCVLF